MGERAQRRARLLARSDVALAAMRAGPDLVDPRVLDFLASLQDSVFDLANDLDHVWDECGMDEKITAARSEE